MNVKIASIEVTRRCNENCFYCERPRGSRDMSLEIFEGILRRARAFGCTALALGGGEPTLHPHLRELLLLARKAKGRAPLGLHLTLTTNSRAPEAVTALLEEGLLDGCGVSAGKGRWQLLAALPQATVNIILLHDRKKQALRHVIEALRAGARSLLMLSYKGKRRKLSPSTEELASFFALVKALGTLKGIEVGADLYMLRRLGLRKECGDDFIRFDIEGQRYKCCFPECEFYKVAAMSASNARISSLASAGVVWSKAMPRRRNSSIIS
jgi:hypothetical protein